MGCQLTHQPNLGVLQLGVLLQHVIYQMEQVLSVLQLGLSSVEHPCAAVFMVYINTIITIITCIINYDDIVYRVL